MPLLIALRSGWIIPLCVCASFCPCVWPPAWGSSKPMVSHHTVPNFKKSQVNMYCTLLILSYSCLQNAQAKFELLIVVLLHAQTHTLLWIIFHWISNEMLKSRTSWSMTLPILLPSWNHRVDLVPPSSLLSCPLLPSPFYLLSPLFTSPLLRSSHLVSYDNPISS